MTTTPWVDFETIKKTVSLEMVLNHYRVDLRGSGGTLRGKCPLPMHGSKESKASFTATLTKGTGGVWACQSASCIKARDGKRGGNALDFVAMMEQCTIREAATKLADWYCITTGKGKRQPAATQVDHKPMTEERREVEEAMNKPLGFSLQGIVYKHPYLEKRGINEATARAFGIGYYPGRGSMQNRVVIPINNANGDLVAYAGRSVDGSEPRYRFPTRFRKGLELYNLHRAREMDHIKRRVVVVEGFFDCVAVVTAGFPCVALMGSSLSEAQEEALAQHFKAICLLLDGDAAGRQATDNILLRLGRRTWVFASMLPDGRQPDSLDVAQITKALMK